MTADDFAKLILVVSLAFALVGIAYQIMRLIGSMADNLSDLRKVTQTLGNLTEKFNDDYDFISEQVKNIVRSVSNFAKNVINPLSKGLGFISRFTKSKNDLSDEDLSEDTDAE